MKKTALSHVHEQNGARMVEFAGYYMPLEYTGIKDEHHAVRNAAGLFDVSHMAVIWIKGEQAYNLVQFLTSNDISLIEIGQAQYSVFPNGNGGIVDDLIVYYYEENKYMLVVNAANHAKDYDWIVKNNSFNAEIEDASEDISLLALQGPKAANILNKISEVDISTMKSFRFVTSRVANVENVIISTTGYTGSGGCELIFYKKDSEVIWNALMEAGKNEGLQAVGLAARDTLRLEMGYTLYGNDIDDSTSALEASLGWATKFTEANTFIDKDYLQAQKEEGIKRKLVGFEVLERGIPRHGYKLFNTNQEEIGEVTSGTMSPTLQKGIGMAYVKTEYSAIGTEVLLQVRNKYIKSKIVKMPFYKG